VEQESDHRAGSVSRSQPTDQPLALGPRFWRRTVCRRVSPRLRSQGNLGSGVACDHADPEIYWHWLAERRRSLVDSWLETGLQPDVEHSAVPHANEERDLGAYEGLPSGVRDSHSVSLALTLRRRRRVAHQFRLGQA